LHLFDVGSSIASRLSSGHEITDAPQSPAASSEKEESVQEGMHCSCNCDAFHSCARYYL